MAGTLYGATLAGCASGPGTGGIETRPDGPAVETVRGRIPATAMGLTLPHEHILCDFIGADQTGPHRWKPDEVVEVMEPYVRAAHGQGVRTFVDCTPPYIGRDVRVLRRLSERTGLHILTPTGLYKAPYLPAAAYSMSADQLTEAWQSEITGGIDGTAIRAGFIKIACEAGPLPEIQERIVRAAALTSRATGAVIACHNPDSDNALTMLDMLAAEGVAPHRYIQVHTQSEQREDLHLAVAERGAFIEYDSVGTGDDARLLRLVQRAVTAGTADRVLLSHDAGWYEAGKPLGGTVRPYTALLDFFVPALRQAGFTDDLIQQLLVRNPQRAFCSF